MSAKSLPSKDNWEPRPGEMHPVDKAFYDLAVKERDYERVKCDRLEAERDRYRDELREAHHWLKAAEMCDCEYFEGAGHKLCRFAEALDG